MSLPVTYFLTEHDGALCVASRSADWSEPRYAVTHFPAKPSVNDVCRAFEITRDRMRELVEVKPTLPGSYSVRLKNPLGHYNPSFTVDLVEFGRTKAVATTYEPVPVPKVGKGTTREWLDGRWRIVPPKGKPRIVTV